MKKALVTAIAALTLGVTAQVGFADDNRFAKEIKARKAVMQVYSFNLGTLGAMAKGKMPYDAKMAQAAADNLNAAVNMKNSAMWPKGSDAIALGKRTRAKPDAWAKYPLVAEQSKALKAAAANMAAAAGKGLDAVKANMKEHRPKMLGLPQGRPRPENIELATRVNPRPDGPGFACSRQLPMVRR